ncbi:DUF2213 domain-containing protein [Candidatus Pacearchaeota archaeon]|nr:DUF2213 domain-containing protein [Candidatus Pacearchaeota archaeon]
MPLMECGEGGYKWGDGGVCFTGPGSREKALAVGRAIAANDYGIIFDDGMALAGKIDDTTGFLTTPVKLARVGIQQYYGFELGLVDRALDLIGVFRSPEEVFSPDSVKSFTNLVVTDDHPNEAVTTDNVKALQKGTVSHVEQKDAELAGVITITDKDQIKKIMDGKLEVSVGYANELVPSVGTFDGQSYEFIQTNIRANHLAIVDAGRCGSACKLITDHKGGFPMVTITIDGIKYEVPEQAAQAYQKYATTMDQRVKDAEEATKKAEQEKKDAEKERDEAQAKKDAAEKEKKTDDEIAVLVADKADLLATAKVILVDKFDDLTKDCGTCDTKMRAAVIAHVMPDIVLDGKSDDYIAAMFDMAVVKHQKAKDSNTKLGKDLIDDKGEVMTRDSVRIAHNKKLGMEVD